ncbi:MAG: response regulator [Candidatus Dadabacteria bacterium]|nr:MAG: response regulator [Candidatus Dadabacteria bacterium]
MDVQLQPPRLLYVDDDPITRRIIETLSKQSGWEYDVVTDGHTALARLSEHTYDVIITDLVMPGINGVELVRNLRSSSAAHEIIIVTERASTDEVIGFLREGASDFIQKPLDRDTLENAVKRALSGVREKAVDKEVYGGIVNERTFYRFRTDNLAKIKMPLHVAERLYEAGRIDLGEKLRLVLAFQEALTNSIEHGNLELLSEWKDEVDDRGLDKYSLVKRERLKDESYAARELTVLIEVADNKLRIVITDQGQGFEPPDDFKQGNVCSLKSHGRGLGIIQSCMNEIRYHDGGRTIEMIKFL